MNIGTIHSEKGFIVGDPCYFMSDEYRKLSFDTDNGLIEVPGTGFSYVVTRAMNGDGDYSTTKYESLSVDSGVIAAVPYELVERMNPIGTCIFIDRGGDLTMALDNTISKTREYIEITTTNGDSLSITELFYREFPKDIIKETIQSSRLNRGSKRGPRRRYAMYLRKERARNV